MQLNGKIFKVFFLLILLSVFAPFSSVEGAMSDYCIKPPFLAQDIPPNVLVVLDNSGSMCGQAYAGSYNPARFSNGQYYGYFDGSKNYLYNGSRWEETTADMTTGTTTNPIANGSFLNWATMRRVEVAKKLLVGGKGNPRAWNGSVTVKLDGEGSSTCDDSFQKDYDTSAGNLIYPFVGNYRFKRDRGHLDVTALSSGDTFHTYPNADVSVPAGWSENPAVGSVVAWTKVGETPADNDTTYIQNNNTTSPVLLDYDYMQSKPAGVITVTIKVRAKKTASGSTRNIIGVLRINGVDYASSSSSISTSYDDYSFTWETNPATGAAWDWTDIKSSGLGSLQAFGVKAANTYTDRFPRITQVYLDISIAGPSGTGYNTIVDMGSVAAVGIFDTLNSKVRFGLAYYNKETSNEYEGANINTYVKFLTTGNLNSMITSVEGMDPETYTPLGETLYEMTRYFRQDDPYYSSNSPADYSTGLAYDPYYYKYTDLDAELADRYVPCAKSYVLFLTDGESTEDQNIPGSVTSSPYSACTLTNIKACSGYGIADADGSKSGYQRFAGTTIGTTYSSSGTDYLADVAYWMRTNDMRPGICTSVSTTAFQQCIPGNQSITLYSVYMFGKGSTLLKDAAIYGGFSDLNGNNKPDCITSPSECYKDSNGDGTISTAGVCSNSTTTSVISCTSDANCTSPYACKFDDPITYYEGEDGYELQASIITAIGDILRRVTSGTAASVLASGEGSGANLIQATYYPKRQFGNDEISWIGSLQNLWYYVDPYFANSNIREEGGGTSKDYILDLKATGADPWHDYILQLYFDTADQKAKARRFTDPAGNGVVGSQLSTIDFENVGSLWNAGTLLWSRDLSSAPRTIKTWLDKNTDGLVDSGEFIDFTTTAYNALSATDKTKMKTSLRAADDATALKTISYTTGYDKFCTGVSTPCAQDSDCVSPATCSGSDYRSRTVAHDLNGDDDVLDAGEGAKVWKLGDIINSTPANATWMPLNNYNTSQSGYSDATYADFISDTSSTLAADSTGRYKNRGMVFVGGNDGMLHAFKLGKLGLKWASQGTTQKAILGKYCADAPGTACVINDDCLTGACMTDAELGKEMWSFIPANVLPYLDYMRNTSYCHLYSVDLPPRIFDASIEGPATACTEANYWDCAKNAASWRTILIGGMRYGGGCKPTTYAGTADAGVKVPVTGEGYSSYFALDVTDPANPTLLWEFSDPELGFATSGPAPLRIRSRTTGPSSTPDSNTDGRWFVVFGSGPTGGIDASEQQFLGNSDQDLKLFILDLKTGIPVRIIDTNIANAYAGSMQNSIRDSDRDYQDDVLYIPYVRKCVSGDTAAICDGAEGKWNNGGVLRLLTQEDLDGANVSGATGGGTSLNPENWQYSTVIDDAGPVTSAVATLHNLNTGKLWLHFGTGRYYYKLITAIDDSHNERQLYGLKDPCFSGGIFAPSCLAGTGQSVTPSDLTSINTTTTAGVVDPDHGWKISLDDCKTAEGAAVACSDSNVYYRTERVITNPVSNPLSGIVFFTTLTPFDDICTSGGNTAIWAVKAESGAAPGAQLQGKALIQVSTGAIEQVDLATAFTQKSGRKTGAMQGVPPTSQGMSIQVAPSAVGKVLHSRER